MLAHGSREFAVRYTFPAIGDHPASSGCTLEWAVTAASAAQRFRERHSYRKPEVLSTMPAYPSLPAARLPYMTYEQVLQRYPRLCRLVQEILIGSLSEAACCIRDYRNGMRFGSEAVSHSGLSPHDRVQSAVAGRVAIRRMDRMVAA